MKIGVNGRFLLKPFTGIGRYTRDLILEVARNHPEFSIVFVVPDVPPVFDSWEFDNVEIIVLPEIKIGSAGIKKTFWEQVQVPRLFSKIKVDVAHFPYPSNPWCKTSFPNIVTVHDTIPWTLNEYRKSFFTKLYQSQTKNSVKKADKILTVSESSKKDIAKTCNIKPEKIDVIYNSLSKYFFETITDKKRKNILKKLNLHNNNPFFLYVGGYDSRKNVDKIINVYLKNVAPYYYVDFVLIGGKMVESKLYKSFDNLTKLKKQSNVSMNRGKIVLTGFIEESYLPALYQSALAFINFSEKEGFNIPLLEALMCGTAVIASDIPVHREVAGNSAVFCGLTDEKCLSFNMTEFAKNSAYRQKQKQKVDAFVNKFSWKSSAQKLANIYKSFL